MPEHPLDLPPEPLTSMPDHPCDNPKCLLAAGHDGKCLTRREPPA